MELEQIKQGQRAAWTAGDFGVIAKSTADVAADFIHRLGIAPGARVLDVACGTGNTTIPLARMGCRVTGLDLAPNLLEQARTRANDEGLDVTLIEGDAEQLPFGNGEFDAVVTMYGAMFAPRPELVASEAARVLRGGGLFAMANWTPESFTGRMFRMTAKHVPPPPGLEPPVRWGDPAVVEQRLGPWFGPVTTEPVPIIFDLPRSPREVVAQFRRYFGPTVVAFNRLDDAGKHALEEETVAMWADANLSDRPHEHTLMHNEYLLVRAIKK